MKFNVAPEKISPADSSVIKKKTNVGKEFIAMCQFKKKKNEKSNKSVSKCTGTS